MEHVSASNSPTERSERSYEDYVQPSIFYGNDSSQSVPVANEFAAYYDEPKISFSDQVPRKKAWRQSLTIGANLIGLVTLVIGVMLTAVMIKKAVDNMADEPETPTADAKQIVSENLSEASVRHAAMAQSTTSLDQPQIANTITSEQTVADSIEKAKNTNLLTKKELKTKKALPPKMESTASADTTNQVASAPVVNEVKEEKPIVDETAAKATAKAGLQVSANDYKKGLFGGISDLVLMVSNPSSQALDNISVEVDFLKPNGKVVGTKIVDVGSLSAGDSKTVPVPDNGRGVSVRYRVVDK
jgi:hypothetical protein